MQVYDCFTFYNEFELLELRLKSLWHMVDYFVLVEANRTQNNKPKPFYFGERMTDFKEFLPKIIHIPLEVNVDYQGVGDWQIENGQRNAIMYGLENSAPDDLIFISDVDEIPSPDILQRINENREQIVSQCQIITTFVGKKSLTVPCQLLTSASELLEYVPIAMNQYFHWYYLDWLNTGVLWQGTILTKRKNLSTPQDLRNARVILPRILDGGWHFSNMGGVERVIKKMTSTVESDEAVVKSNGKILDENHIRNCLKNGLDIWDRGRSDFVTLEHRDISNIKLPYLKEFVKRYPYFLREYDFGED